MLRNRLAELLSERQLKITQVAKDTGISRNTITATAQNDNKMIQYETIDALCHYLRIEPKEFFEYEPIIYKFHIEIVKLEVNFTQNDVYEINKVDIDLEFDFFIDLKINNDLYNFNLSSFNYTDEIGNLVVSVDFDKSDDSQKFKELFYDNISAGLKIMFDKEAESFISKDLLKHINHEISESDFEYYRNFKEDDIIILLEWSLPF